MAASHSSTDKVPACCIQKARFVCRYKQVFADKISVFRQACTYLFGYVIEMSDSQDAASGAPITTFSIRSIYADDEE